MSDNYNMAVLVEVFSCAATAKVLNFIFEVVYCVVS